ncbi:CRIB domain-containing protein RIC4 isoform X2 [Cajanus cajan]|uniref:CRIB domain-containing protein RIC4 isoform X2 n=1 Tax=Cajanus cajan TaxID=3821 RepID=UPI00098DCE85|nr:CRIB domain-containing protein RIC4 isoform X2 [Cajanus cajan]
MRQRMERLVILPFSAGCISEASVAVGIPQPRRSKPGTNLPAATIMEKDDEFEEVEIDMEIGCPTDVQHVTHIGWDGIASSAEPIRGWDALIPPELLSLSSQSLKRQEASNLDTKLETSSPQNPSPN